MKEFQSGLEVGNIFIKLVDGFGHEGYLFCIELCCEVG